MRQNVTKGLTNVQKGCIIVSEIKRTNVRIKQKGKKKMTKKALKKIEGSIYERTLEFKKKDRQRFEEMRLENDAIAIRCSIAGYLHALRDCGIITEREREILFIYYGTI